MGDCFNQSINNLPNLITHLILDIDFNKPINNLPNIVTYLTLIKCFNQPINNLDFSIETIKQKLKFSNKNNEISQSNGF